MSNEEEPRQSRNGQTYREMADAEGISHMTAYRRLNGDVRRPAAERLLKDGETIQMVPHNGGCSTTSGLVPVTVAAAGIAA